MSQTPRPPARPEPEPWIETRVGGWVFVNAVLVAPALMVAFPHLVRWLLRTLGAHQGPSPFLDTIPMLAGFAVPYLGWLALIPVLLVIRTLRMRPGPRARLTLLFFLLVHLVVLGYTIWWWLFSRTFPEPPMA